MGVAPRKLAIRINGRRTVEPLANRLRYSAFFERWAFYFSEYKLMLDFLLKNANAC